MVIIINDTAYHPAIPSKSQLKKWVIPVLKSQRPNATLSINLVDETESAALNQQYRNKAGPTNILSFCFEPPVGMQSNILGDIILCPALIEKEISILPFSKNVLEARWAHLLIHGCLHLLGYHHDDDQAAHRMEALEIEHLATFNYPNPYQ